jgi:cell division protein FtsW
MVYSASGVRASARLGDDAYFLEKQILFAALGLPLLLVLMRTDYHLLAKPAVIWTLLAFTVAALLAVFFFPERNSAHRWITIGPLTVQPSEFAKLVAILFAAALLERRMHRVNDLTGTLLPIAAVTFGLAGLIVIQPDFGAATVLVMVVATVLFVAGLRLRYMVVSGLALIPGGIVLMLMEPYRLQRLLSFFATDGETTAGNFQLMQAKIAVGTGGVTGLGFPKGVQKMFYLPEPHTDFIYAVIAEELGLIGATLALAAFLIIAWRGLRTALVAPDRFGSFLALGFTTLIAIQALFNISVVLGLVPTKGIALPFISAGGSSLLANLLAMGVIINISQRASATVASGV